MKSAEEIIEKIEEIQRDVEREVEWPLTDHVDPKDIAFLISQINSNLTRLKQITEEQVK